MRRGESAILTGERGSCDLGDHEAGIQAGFGREECGKHAGEGIGHLLNAAFGDAAECGDGDCDLIGSHGERLAMKISPADNVAFSVFLYKTNWLVVALVSSTCAISRA